MTSLFLHTPRAIFPQYKACFSAPQGRFFHTSRAVFFSRASRGRCSTLAGCFCAYFECCFIGNAKWWQAEANVEFAETCAGKRCGVQKSGGKRGNIGGKAVAKHAQTDLRTKCWEMRKHERNKLCEMRKKLWKMPKPLRKKKLWKQVHAATLRKRVVV